jgi:hypothetical protein
LVNGWTVTSVGTYVCMWKGGREEGGEVSVMYICVCVFTHVLSPPSFLRALPSYPHVMSFPSLPCSLFPVQVWTLYEVPSLCARNSACYSEAVCYLI